MGSTVGAAAIGVFKDAPEALLARRLGLMEDRLVDRSIDLAKSNGYTPFTTTVRAAWTEAVRSLTEALESYLLTPKPDTFGPLATIEYRRDPRFAGMRLIARKHRAVGISLELYLGLFKHFRRVYTEALLQVVTDPETHALLLDRVVDFFDETELSVTADWTEAGEDQRLRELQLQTRSLTLVKDRYVAIFESLRNPAFLLNHAHHLVHANQAALTLFVGAGEAGDSLYLHVRHELRQRLEQMLGDLFSPDTEPEQTIWKETENGLRCFDLRLRPLHDAVQNSTLGYLLQLYDVTDYQEATEQAEKAARQMSRFLAMMSHEIRTPLHGVLGAAELLRISDDLAQPVYLDVIQSAGQSLLQTLNNVLDYSKMENGPPEPRPSCINLAQALNSFCAMIAARPGPHRESLSLRLASDVPHFVSVDWAMIFQVLTNLVSNALRHDSGAGVALDVDLVARDDLAIRMLRFTVTDHGPGLPAEDSAALHLPFEEAKARRTINGGTGLGLAISRYLVCAMGGRIDFCNTPSGARIWFEIPFQPASAQAPEALEYGAISGIRPGGRCLLVDDDPIGALVSSHQIKLAGFTVDNAATIKAARSLVAETDYDAVIIDYLLPDGTGPELLKSLRSAPDADRRVYIALTANLEAFSAAPDLRKGFHHILGKPTNAAQLAKALQECTAQKRMRSGTKNAMPDPGVVSAGTDSLQVDIAALSPSTLKAMAEALRQAWSEFRKQLRRSMQTAPCDELKSQAHRLAGSTAQLGITELAGPLRALEQRCDAGPAADISDLVILLDRPIEQTAFWRSLARIEVDQWED